MLRRLLQLLLCCLLPVVVPAQLPQLIIPGGHTRAIVKLETSPGGGLLASSSIDETVKIWETTSGRELHTFRPGDLARDLAFSADGRYLAVAAFNRVHVLDLTDFREVATFEGWFTNGVRFHPGRNELYYLIQQRNSTGEDPQQVYAVTLPGGAPRRLGTVPMGTSRGVAQLDIRPDGEELLIVLPSGEGHLMPAGGGAARPAGFARRYTPEGELFYLRPDGNNVTFGLTGRSGEARWSIATPKNEASNQQLVHVSGFHDGRMYWVNTEGKLANGTYQDGKMLIRNLPAAADRVLTTSVDGWLYLAGKNPYVIYRYRLPDLSGTQQLGEALLAPQVLAGTEAGNQLSWGFGKVKSLTIDGRHLVVENHDGVFPGGRMHYSTDGSLLATSPGDGDVFGYRAPARHDKVVRFKSGYADTRAVAPNANGLRLAVVSKDGYRVMNTESGKSVANAGLRAGDAYYQGEAALSPDGSRLLLAPACYTGSGQQTRTQLRLVEVAGGTPVWEQPVSLEDPVFSADGNSIFGQIFEHFVQLDAATGKELRKWPLPPVRFPYQVNYDAAREWAAYTHDFRAYLFHLTDGQEYRLTVPGETEISFDRMDFFGDGFVAAAGREGVVRVFDVRSKQYVAALLQYADTDNWAIVTPDGRFDASPGAMTKMYYRIGQQRIALEQLFEGFYTPGLAGEIFGRRPGSLETPSINLNNLLPPPEVEISYQAGGTRNLIVEDDVPEVRRLTARTQDAVLRLKASAPGSTVTELRLYHNGKLIGSGTRNLVVEDDVAPVNNEREYRVRLLPGANEFRAVAINGQRTESSPARLTLDFVGEPSSPAPPTSSAPASAQKDPPLLRGADETESDLGTAPQNQGVANVTLHLLTVGIDRYANPEYNLNYATADAGGIEEVLRRGMSPLVGRTDALPLRDGKADRAGILAALRQIVADADADDLFVFYYAGHGIMSGGNEGEFYFVPHDVTSLSGLAASGISARELQNLSTAIPAHRQLFLLDACQSAGAVAALPGATEEKAIAQLARTTGTHWITATGTEQLASEFDQLGHGAFTYALLEALRGKAAGADGEVSVSELKTYLARSVPELTRRYNGTAQYPASYGFGQDFTVSIWR